MLITKLDDERLKPNYYALDSTSTIYRDSLKAALEHIRIFYAENARLINERDAALREMEAWKDSAATFSRNADYYRGLVTRIGEMFRIEAKTSDDGTVQEDVLCAKVPELVAAALARAEKAEGEVCRMREALERIAMAKYCEGPSCLYCDEDHPPSSEALLLRSALSSSAPLPQPPSLPYSSPIPIGGMTMVGAIHILHKKELAKEQEIADALGNTRAVAMRNYAKDRREG